MKMVWLIRLCLCLSTGIGLSCPGTAEADEYRDTVLPFLQKYCVSCHAGAQARGELDLTSYAAAGDVVDSFRRWMHIIAFIRDGEMPPQDAPQPVLTESRQVTAVIEAILISEAEKQAGDPGVVLPRRLSCAEYDRCIHDLTGFDLRPARDFPPDPAGGEGFDNTGESLRMSPSLLKKFLAAAQRVADHMVLKPDGIFFAPFPVTSYNERRKLTEQAIIDFYNRHAISLLDYLEAAWRFRYRPADQAGLSIDDWVSERGLSTSYLAIVQSTLNATETESALSQQLRRRWEALPPPSDDSHRPPELLELAQFIESVRTLLSVPHAPIIQSHAGNWPIGHLAFRANVAAGRDRFDPAALKPEMLLHPVAVPKPDTAVPQPVSVFIQFDQGFSDAAAYVVVRNPIFSQADHLPRSDDEKSSHRIESLRSLLSRTNPDLLESLRFGFHPAGDPVDGDSFVVSVPTTIEIPLSVETLRELDGRSLLLPCALDLKNSGHGSVLVRASLHQSAHDRFAPGAAHLINPQGQTARDLIPAAQRFCQTFPERFCYVDDSRGLAAGFHLVEGFFRDDRPLVEHVLSDAQKSELDRLWQELNFVTEASATLLSGFVWFERSEREVLHDERFDFLRPEDPDLGEESKLTRFEKLYLDKLGVRRVGDTREAESPDQHSTMIHNFFDDIRAGLSRQRELMDAAEVHALSDVQEFARRAFRRPLRSEEREALRTLYRTLRAEGQSVEGAVRGVLTAVLMSPNFCYHAPSVVDGPGIYPLRDHDLASRLSLFLWSGLPDDELLAAAATHGLQDEKPLRAQTRRMLQDPRIMAFAREFVGQWLRYRDFLQKDPVNALAFPGYSDTLREAMFEEPTRLITHLIRTDRPVTDLLNSDLTFVNQALARHYGGEIQRQYLAATALLPEGTNPDEQWHLVQGLKAEGRGGLFGMAVVLTKNSAGERTSPVRRGFWTVHHLLGQHFPPPPADIPELPASETKALRTIRQLLADHVADAKCAMCHRHFDSLGLAMEGFDPIGRSRTTDSAGRPIDDRAELPNGDFARGIPELIVYIEQQRRHEFIRTLCRKFLGYALGRSVLLSDESLLDEMEQELINHEYRFSSLFEAVVGSPQFRNHRGRDFEIGRQPPDDGLNGSVDIVP